MLAGHTGDYRFWIMRWAYLAWFVAVADMKLDAFFFANRAFVIRGGDQHAWITLVPLGFIGI